MIRRRLWISLLGIVSLAIVMLGINLGTRNAPVLGLDLQGGVSVILAPQGGASADDLLVIRDLIRDELENRGIAEPNVRVEGNNIVVDLPGVKDQRDALDAVDVAGIVSLRPVMQACSNPEADAAAQAAAADAAAAASSVPTGDTTAGSPPADGTAVTTDAVSEETTGGSAGASRPAALRHVAGADTTDPTDSSDATTSTESGSSVVDTDESESASSEVASDSSVPATTEATTTTTTEPPLGPLGTSPLNTVPDVAFPPAPPSPDDSMIALPDRDGNTCLVGPVQRGPGGESGGFVFARNSARSELNQGQWQVVVDLTGEGQSTFNALAGQCFQATQSCPTRQLAIVLDDIVQSAPQVNAPQFDGSVNISGSFTQGEARSLARVLDRGAFPVQVEAQTVQTVSATLGKDSMRASILAGLAGVALVLLLLVYFYRRLILVVIAGIAVWGMLIYSASAFVSQTTNFALTLAGVTGIIVAIGVTVDSYVVYFERLKDEVRHGRTMRNSAGRGFKATWKTILAADLVSLLASVVLFALSVGSVRGFALYLGITTVCDLVVCYFFTRPAIGLLADKGWLDRGDIFGLEVDS